MQMGGNSALLIRLVFLAWQLPLQRSVRSEAAEGNRSSAIQGKGKLGCIDRGDLLFLLKKEVVKR